MTLQARNSIFQAEWWLDALAPGSWDQVTIHSGTGLAARLPFVVKKKLGFTMLVMPPLSQTLGPWISPSEAKYAKQFSREKKLLEELIDKLPVHDFFQQNFHSSITNWLPFRWASFSQTTFYTYALDNISDTKALWAEMLPRVRTDIKKAENRFGLTVERGDDIDELHRLLISSFKRKGKKAPHQLQTMIRLYEAVRQHNAGQLFFARDDKGTAHSGALIVWDNNCAYYLVGGSDAALRHSGAASLLLWHAIQTSAEHATRFDFEGSMVQGIEQYFRAFGARQVPYFHIERYTSPLLAKIQQIRMLFS